MPKEMSETPDPARAVMQAGLFHLRDGMPGVTRIRTGKGFSYPSERQALTFLRKRLKQ